MEVGSVRFVEVQKIGARIYIFATEGDVVGFYAVVEELGGGELEFCLLGNDGELWNGLGVGQGSFLVDAGVLTGIEGVV